MLKLAFFGQVRYYLSINVFKFSPVKSVCNRPSGPDQTNVLLLVVAVEAKVFPTNSEDHGPNVKNIVLH